MRRTIISIVVFVVVFLAGTFATNWYFGSSAGDATVDMDEAALPLVYTKLAGKKVNCLHGYVSDVDASLLRDTVTPMEGSSQVTFVISPKEEKIHKVRYEVRSSDASSLVEDGKVTDLKKMKSGEYMATVSVRMQLKAGQDYILKLIVEETGGVDVSYYTRVIYNEQMHVSQQLAFVQNFHEVLFNKQKAEEIQKYLECDASKISNDLGKVDITSSFESITYADMKPKQVKDVTLDITDITQDIAYITLRYVIAASSTDNNTEYFEATENYKVRYTPERMYLLSYDRTMSADYNPVFTDTAKNSLKLGISTSSDLQYRVSDDCKIAAFVKNRELYLYDYQNIQVAKVFSFNGEQRADKWDSYDHHDIRILSLSKKGDLVFAVYGYMNRGRHEGQNGITFYRYKHEDNQITEVAFIPSQQPFETLKQDVSQVCYMNQKNVIYLTLGGQLYCVDVKTQAVDTLLEGVAAGAVAAAADGHLAAVQEKAEIGRNRQITMKNLNTGVQQKVQAAKGEVIRVIGFVGDDLVYGKIRRKDLSKKDTGKDYIPMYEIEIRSEEGKTVMSYQPPNQGSYIIAANVKGNVVEMKFGKKTGSALRETGSDYIMSKAGDSKKGTVTLEYEYSSVRYKEVFMVFPNYIYVTKAPACSFAKEIAADGNHTIVLEGDAEGFTRYFVYVNANVVDSFNTISQAIAAADTQGGVVVNSHHKTVWEKSGLQQYGSVNDEIPVVKVAENASSMAGCIQMIANYEGKKVTMNTIANREDGADRILTETLGKEGVNLTGCSLDEVMYYICQGHPVIAKDANGRFVLLTSFNLSLLKYTDPVTGEIQRRGFDTMRKEFENVGNVFYSYLK